MSVGRRVLIRNAALLAAAQGCARRIPAAPDVPANLDALGQIHVPAASAPQLQSVGGAVSAGPPGGPGVLIANLGPRLAAFDRYCPHAQCELTFVPEDREIECPCHGSRFASDGAVLHPPAVTDLRTFPIEVEPNGDFIVHFYPADGTYPMPGADRKLVLDLGNYPKLAPVFGSVFGFVEGPPGALLVMRTSATEFSAVNAYCTHRACTVRGKADGVIQCPCHGSQFQSDGSLMTPRPVGPAPFPLSKFATSLSGNLLTIQL